MFQSCNSTCNWVKSFTSLSTSDLFSKFQQRSCRQDVGDVRRISALIGYCDTASHDHQLGMTRAMDVPLRVSQNSHGSKWNCFCSRLYIDFVCNLVAFSVFFLNAALETNVPWQHGQLLLLKKIMLWWKALTRPPEFAIRHHLERVGGDFVLTSGQSRHRDVFDTRGCSSCFRPKSSVPRLIKGLFQCLGMFHIICVYLEDSFLLVCPWFLSVPKISSPVRQDTRAVT